MTALVAGVGRVKRLKRCPFHAWHVEVTVVDRDGGEVESVADTTVEPFATFFAGTLGEFARAADRVDFVFVVDGARLVGLARLHTPTVVPVVEAEAWL